MVVKSVISTKFCKCDFNDLITSPFFKGNFSISIGNNRVAIMSEFHLDYQLELIKKNSMKHLIKM